MEDHDHDVTVVLPEDCISLIISLTSPPDACRLSAVSPVFKSAADSDAVWEKFLPSDYHEMIMIHSNLVSSSVLLNSLSKKDLYFHLCNNPILINEKGTMCFTLDKGSGKKCYMIGARALSISWKDTHTFWLWKSLRGSRFAEVAELKFMHRMDVKGTIDTNILSPKTTYGAYLVYKFAHITYGFENKPVQLSVYFEGTDHEPEKNYAVLIHSQANNISRQSLDKGDGWMEVQMGEFFVNEHGDDRKVVCSLFDMAGLINNKRGLIIEGIMIRPKS